MLTQSGLSKMSNVLSKGFFADQVIRSLRKDDTLTKKRKDVLNQIVAFIDQAKSGREQVSAGKLHDDAIRSINAYNTFLDIISRMNVTNDDRMIIEKFSMDITREVNDALTRKMITPEKFPTTLEFFHILRDLTLQQSELTFGWENPILRGAETAV